MATIEGVKVNEERGMKWRIDCMFRIEYHKPSMTEGGGYFTLLEQ